MGMTYLIYTSRDLSNTAVILINLLNSIKYIIMYEMSNRYLTGFYNDPIDMLFG